MDGTGAIGRAQTCSRWKPHSDQLNSRRKQPIGTAEHSVLLVNNSRQTERRGRQHRRDRGIAAKADDPGGGQSAQQLTCLHNSEDQFGERFDCLTGPAAEPPGAHAMDFDPRNASGKGIDSSVAQKVDSAAVAEQLARQRLRREHMSSGAAGSEREGHAHSAPPASRRRVSASIIPMPSPSASIEDPPYDRKGSVIPLVGIKCRLDAMLITAWSPNWINKPVAARSTNKLPS